MNERSIPSHPEMKGPTKVKDDEPVSLTAVGRRQREPGSDLVLDLTPTPARKSVTWPVNIAQRKGQYHDPNAVEARDGTSTLRSER